MRVCEAPARLHADLHDFLRRCLAHGFLQEQPGLQEPGPERIHRVGPHRFLALRAWWWLARTTRSLATKGFARTYQACTRVAIPARHAGESDERLRRSVAAFATAENVFLSQRAPSDCLSRSLALFCFLRSTGVPVEHCIGVRRIPFQAHAWVEYEGRVVQDSASHSRQFAVLARIPA